MDYDFIMKNSKFSDLILKSVGPTIEIFTWTAVVVLLATLTVTAGFRAAVDAVIPVAIFSFIALLVIFLYSRVREGIEENKAVRIKVKMKRKGKKMLLQKAEDQ